MKENNLAVFDLDGVILETIDCKTKAFRELYSEYGEEIQNKIEDHHLRNGGISRFEKIKFYHKNFLNINLSEDDFKSQLSKFSQLVLAEVYNSKFVENVEYFIKELSKKFVLVLSTGTPTEEAKKILNYKKIDNFFINIFGSPDSKLSHLQGLFKYNQYNKKIFFGDALSDYEAAMKYKMNFILRLHNKNKFMLRKKNIFKIIKNFENLNIREFIND